ncbi:MAG: bifunctional 5,10-methylenetetrahydrofolate dehydrogenase/5,10-methenyltetrahydrofolate cyclohydrolase [Actinomycetota bacterium]|nr:bifunctional 5,10-methylenetetrahydrofolate dehydrogenase/5,10-methenyltetrahydrofolate cyclohydrolase [Actinomycetota bacterium]
MSARVLDGNLVAAAVKEEVAQEVLKLKTRGIVPGLGTILVGDDPSSSKYVAMKHRDCEEVGIVSHHRHLSANSTFDSLLDVIASFNDNVEVDSILLQLPIPKHLNQLEALLAIDPQKDVDGLHPVNLGKLVMSEEAPLPCTPAGIVRLLAHYEIEVEGRHVVVVGRGLTIGRPLALLLASKRPDCNATVTVCHTGSKDMASVVREGDVVVAAAGVANLIDASMIKGGAVVVGAGTPFVNGKLASDVADDVAEVASAVTPRVGGVGPMTRAMLLKNTVSAAQKRH